LDNGIMGTGKKKALLVGKKGEKVEKGRKNNRGRCLQMCKFKKEVTKMKVSGILFI
jgi:hypothetical protein